MEERPRRFKVLPVVLAVVVVAAQVIGCALGDFAVRQGLPYLMGKTCSVGALGAYVHGLEAIVFDLPLALATVLLVVLPWSRMPRWAHVALLAGLAYRLTKNIYLAGLGEIIGTGLLGSLVSVWIVAPLLMGKTMALATLMIAFSVSTVGGTIIGIIALQLLRKGGVWQP